LTAVHDIIYVSDIMLGLKVVSLALAAAVMLCAAPGVA
jgi:hypothetical protein